MIRNPELKAFEQKAGIFLPGCMDYSKPEWASNYDLAMDAQPTLISTPSGGIPAFLTTLVDPDLIRILIAPNNGAKILGEVRKGSWVDKVAMFPIAELTGETSAYGDYSANGRAGANVDFPQRQSFLYQTFVEYGDLEMETMGLAKIGWANEQKEAAVAILNKYQNLTYFFGVQGLQNYGLLNDPSLAPPIAPAVKAATGTKWSVATAAEVYTDVQSLYGQLVAQTAGLIEMDTPMTLAMSPASYVNLTKTNIYNVNVIDQIKKNFPNIKVETAVQYGALTAINPQGSAAGEIVQLIATKIEGQDTGYCAFNEKLRAFPILRGHSSYAQKYCQGTWGAIIRMPMAIATMIGV